MRVTALPRWLIAVAVFTAAVSCGGSDLTLPSESVPAYMAAVAGDSQAGIVGQPLADTLVIRLTDPENRPVRGQKVLYHFLAGGTGGSLIPDTAVTDADGRARSVWVLGHIAGAQRVEARVLAAGAASGLSEQFTATATSGVADTLIAVAGDQQQGTVSRTLAESLSVAVTDKYGNPIPGDTVNWSVPAGQGSVSAVATVTGPDGRAAVQRTLGPNAGTQTASAAWSGLPTVPVVFTSYAAVGGITKLVKLYGDNQTAPAGSRLTDSIVVQAQDSNGNGVSGRSVVWVVSSGGGSVSANTTTTDSHGKAYVYWTIGTVAGPNTVTATIVGLPQATFSATGTASLPTKIAAISSQTLTGVASQFVSPAPSVKVTDNNNNPVQGVTVTFVVTAGGGAVSDGTGTGDTATVATNSTGIATLASWTLGPLVGTNTVTASALGTGGTPLTGSPVTFNATSRAGQPGRLAFVAQPSDVGAGVVMSPAVTVQVEDIGGNPIPTATNPVTLSIATNVGGATLGGTITMPAVNGIATFSTLTLNKTGVGYTLAANGSGLVSGTSSAFNVTNGPAAKLGFIVQPPALAGSSTPMSPAVQVAVQDQFGNTVPTRTDSITVAIGTNPSAGTLSGTLKVAAVAGVATFSTLAIDKTGTGYTLTAAATGLTGATSAAFNVGAGAPAKLVFIQQPSNVQAGAAIAPAITVQIQDVNGNNVPTATDSVFLAIGTNPGGATLTGSRVAAVAGVATFNGVTLNKSGTGYTLIASGVGLTNSPASNAFNVTPGTGQSLSFTVQPSNVAAGVAITPAVVVSVLDQLGNVATGFTGSITVGLVSGQPLGGTVTVPVTNGVATFNNLTVSKVGTNQLIANNPNANVAVSNSFTVTPGAPASLQFTQQPTTTFAGRAMSPAIQVTILDVGGNTVTTSTANVTLAIGTNSGGSTLGGTATVAAAAGVATFLNISLNKVGTNYTLTAASTGVPTITSATFNINAANPAFLAFGQPPTNVVAGVNFNPPITVQVLDSFGNIATAAGATVNLTLVSNPGGATLSGVSSGAVPVNGIATFPSASLNKTGTGYTIQAYSFGTVSITSSPFNVTPNTAARLVFSVQPSNSVAGAATISPTVQIQDVDSNVVTTSTASVSVAIGTNPGGGTLSGTATVNATAGVAAFPTLSINKIGTGYTLNATSGALTAPSAAFNITAGVPTTVTKTAGDGQTTTAGNPVTIPPQVTVTDANGNPVAGVTVTFAVATGGGAVSNGTQVTNAAGVAAVTSWSVGPVAGPNSLTATVSGVAPVTFTATGIAGTGAKLALATQPSTTAQAGVNFAVQPVVQLQDVNGNNVTTSGVAVTALIQSGGGTLNGTTTVNTNASGQAVFTGLSISGLVGSRTLVFTATGYSSINPTTPTNITAGPASAIAISAGNGQNATVGTAVAIPPAVVVTDAFTNPVSGTNVTFAVASGGGTVNPTTAIATSASGIAAVTSWTLGTTAGSNSLTATSAGLSGSPLTFTATGTAGNATKLAIATQPSASAGSGTPFAQQPVIQLQDASGNPVATSGVSVTAAIASGTGGTLGGTTTVTTSNGVATFTNLSLSGTAGNFTLSFSASGLTGVTSGTITLGAGGASKLAITTQPSASATSGTQFAQQPVIQLQDASGNNVTTSGVSVTAAIASGTGGTLTGTTTVTTTNGVATFSNLTLTGTAGNFTLSFSGSGLTGATSNTITLGAGAASKLSITTQPAASATSGVAFAPQPVIQLQDASGNNVTTSGVSVTAAIASGTGATLGGTATVTTSNGVATFTNLSLSGTAGSFTLSFSASGLTGATSSTITLGAGGASKLAISTQPSASATSGTQFGQQPVIQLQDASGNNVTTSGVSVTAAIASGTGGTLTGTTTVTTTNGVATFSNLTLTGTAGNFTLSFSSSGLTGATSNTIALAAGSASKLVISIQPSASASSGTPFAQQPVIQLQDASGNNVTTSGVSVSAAIASGTGGTLGGTTTVTTSSGVATFTNLSLSGTAGNFTLSFSASGLTGATSSTITLGAGGASKLAISIQPSASATSGTQFAQQPVIQLQDASGNNVTTSGVSVSAAIASGTGGTLSGTTTVTTSNGVATFTNLTLTGTAGNFTLSFSASGLTSATSNTIALGAGAAAKLSITTQPSASVAAGSAFSTQPVVRLLDASNNPVTTSGVVITATIGSGSGGVLVGTTTATTSSGVATFSTLGLGGTAGNFTLTFTSGALATATSNTISVTAGPVSAAASTATVPNGTAGNLTTITIQGRDQYGNAVATGGATVVVTITGTNPGSASVVDNGNGTYTATYTPAVAGPDTIAITLNGTAISGSPFTSTVS